MTATTKVLDWDREDWTCQVCGNEIDGDSLDGQDWRHVEGDSHDHAAVAQPRLLHRLGVSVAVLEALVPLAKQVMEVGMHQSEWDELCGDAWGKAEA